MPDTTTAPASVPDFLLPNGEIDVAAMEEFTRQLPAEDGVPLESPWHYRAIYLLIGALTWHWRDRHDYFCGGNMFIYFSLRQVYNEAIRGPDFFVVKGVNGKPYRDKWVVWMEDGKYPNLIIEFLSPSTARVDRTTKKQLYQDTFRTAEYFLYDPATQQLEGWRLVDQVYEPLQGNDRGWLWSEQLGLWLGQWAGAVDQLQATWLRFYHQDGRLALLRHEEAEQRLQTSEQRLQSAAEEIAQLKARLAELERSAQPPA
jgi:Uma2 family endonuclease